MLEERRERSATWLQEERLQLTRAHELLLRDGVAVSYTTLREFARDARLRRPPTTTLQMAQWLPGEVAEIDFGKLGSIVDVGSGRWSGRWSWSCPTAVTASHGRCSSRRWEEKTIAGLEAAWQYFGGVLVPLQTVPFAHRQLAGATRLQRSSRFPGQTEQEASKVADGIRSGNGCRGQEAGGQEQLQSRHGPGG